ncbi:polyketide synthase, partial [cf. Phormidesmis sp. LEGE 11477]|uniref:polyketide synthase n=1 Tax=cf. Phormidesmis sp. LEGE 11477 TaxID=1828680 RepID=UPI0019F4DF6E
AEGGGIVVLKRLSEAQAAGDRIQAVILGSATNHDGRTNGLTAPSNSAQVAVIQQALSASRLTPAEVDYVETHGTGTALGDPIEVGALGQVFAEAKRTKPIVLGALKTNIGHAEAAAGMAGLIKAVLAIEHKQIPANLHLDRPNPLIDWAALPFHLPQQTMPWPAETDVRTVGVSAFGFNGTNAHLIVQSPSKPLRISSEQSSNALSNEFSNGSAVEEERDREQPHSYLLPLSARSAAALTQLVARYAQYLAAHSDSQLADLCFTASVGRSHFPYRLAVVSTSLSTLRQKLIAVLSGRPQLDCYYSDSYKGDKPKGGKPKGDSSKSNKPNSDKITRSKTKVPFSPSAVSPSAISLAATAKQYVNGETVNWGALYQGRDHNKLALPTYPFQREYYGPGRDQL